jgi:hypothetical protein
MDQLDSNDVKRMAGLAGIKLSEERAEHLIPLLTQQFELLNKLRPIGIFEDPAISFSIKNERKSSK